MANGTQIRIKDNIRRVLKGTPLTLAVNVNHKSITVPEGSMLEYTWTKNGVPFGDKPGELDYHGTFYSREFWSRPSIVLENIQPSDEGIYQCEVKNHFGSISSTPITVEVFDIDENPLIRKNIIINPNAEEGTLGWTISEGTFQMHENFFWSGFTRRGQFGNSSLYPRKEYVASDAVMPDLKESNNYFGYFIDENGNGKVRIHQIIDLSSIVDIIDRKVEGVTSVDMKMGAYLGSPRFHRMWGYTRNKLADDGGAMYEVGRADFGNGQSGDPNHSPVIYWYLEHRLVMDEIILSYTFLNVKGEPIKTIELQNCPNSYQRNLLVFKHRRTEIPEGAKQLKVELYYRREGTRKWDDSINDIEKRILKGAVWGMQARIYVNEQHMSEYNPNYTSWSLPSKMEIHPAAINMIFTDSEDVKNWVIANEPVKDGETSYWANISDDTQTAQEHSGQDVTAWDLWLGYSNSSYSTYRKAGGQINWNWKCFDMQGHRKSSFDTYACMPVPIKQATLAAHNIKRINLTWLFDHATNKFDQYGKESFFYIFSNPETASDIMESENALKQRRTLITTNDYEAPSLKQIIRIEDIDKAINIVHSDTSYFRPATEAAWSFKEMEYDMQNGTAMDTRDSYVYLKSPIYEPFQYVTAPTVTGDANYEQFLTLPKDKEELEAMYDNLVSLYRIATSIYVNAAGKGPVTSWP